jgi:HlyD family secretion protein
MYLSVIAVVAGGLVWSFWPQPVLVEVAAVGHAPLRVTVDEDGRTRVRDRYIVAAPLAGRLQRIELDPGDRVTAGDTVLATIEPQEPELLDPRAVAQAEARVRAAEAALARAEPVVERASAELAFADNLVARYRTLVLSNAVAKERLEELDMLQRARSQDRRAAIFARDIARFELEMARAALLRSNPADLVTDLTSHFSIKSPVSGQVLRILQRSATVVRSGTELIEVGDASDLEVEVDVLSSDGVAISPGAKASLEQWGGDKPLDAVVRLVEPSAFTKISALGVEEQRVNVILDLLAPPEQRQSLGDGFRVEARIVLWEGSDVLQTPTGSLFRHGDDWAVFVVADGVARLRTVQLGRRNSLAAQVLDGLQPGELVILHPSDQVRDDIAVQQRDVAGP